MKWTELKRQNKKKQPKILNITNKIIALFTKATHDL